MTDSRGQGGIRALGRFQEIARRAADAIGRDTFLVRSVGCPFERLLEVASRGRGVPWSLNGVDVLVHPRHRRQMGRIYDPEVAAYLAGRVEPGDVCLNVGANVGVYVLQLGHWSAPTGRVVAFEPNPRAAESLASHVHINRLDERVEIVHAAVADESGSLLFHMSGTDGMSRLGAPNPKLPVDGVETAVVETVTLDDFCETNAVEPDWIVIDVEGFEMRVLAGASRLIATAGARLGLVMEMHPGAWHVAGDTRATASSLLRDLRLEPVSLSGQRDPLGEYGQVALRSLS